ncbi:hypothetical protein [Dactylosporangium sp. NPDC051484]|uniref:hypothetical protein n=1 Tax=Dactylosporangium sp. NPDC051484 TaxID=3154942 RepID=UPI00344BAB83
MAEEQQHPTWCERASCTAYVAGMQPLHRSAPFVIADDDPSTVVLIHRETEIEGWAEYLVISKVDNPTPQPWYLAEPVGNREISLPQSSAGAALQALASMA